LASAWRRGLCAVLLLLLPGTAFAQRELHWDALIVTARLNADGSLSVVEDQTIVFTGAWNGGERTFDIRPGQRLSFDGMSRWTGTTWQPMTRRGSLSNVDDYAFAGATVLRWRSRLPTDPPFDHTEVRYQLRYRLAHILRADGDTYTLDSDFAFPKRDGVISRYELHLTLDPAWQPTTPVPDVYTATDLAPGQSFVVTLTLRYAGSGVPEAFDGSRPPAIRAAVLAIAGFSILSILWMFVSERAKGRFDRLDASAVDAGWLRDHVLKYPAELISAAWDDSIGRSEVVTILARMTADGKLESQVSGTSRHAGMTLHLKVDRGSLEGYERALVDKLFFDGRTTTSTDDVKAHYKKTGFNPVSLIQPGLEKRLQDTMPFANAPRRYAIETAALLIAGAGLLVASWRAGDLPGPAAPLIFVGTLFAAVLASIPGTIFRTRLDWGYAAALVCLLAPAMVAGGAMAFLWFEAGSGAVALSTSTIAAIAALALAATIAGINALRSRQRREGVAFRKQLAAARLFFMAELHKPAPALDDAWYPWVLAFDLGRDVDDWSARRATSSSDTGVILSSTHSGSTSSNWTGFGGGHSGGAGATAAWAVAAGSLAAGVATPGSSSSGGGSSGGGGGSSGGGGGGW
jgi:hypothetical protein